MAKNLNKGPYEIMDAEAQQVELGSANLIFLPYLMVQEARSGAQMHEVFTSAPA